MGSNPALIRKEASSIKQHKGKLPVRSEPPCLSLGKTETTVYQALQHAKSWGDRDLVQYLAEKTRMSDLQIKAALVLLLQKKVISSEEIIDSEIW
jgi:hypothetical protein